MSDPESVLDYPRWITEALRVVAQRALEHVEHEGLPDEHHFLLSFRTRAEGVRVPAAQAREADGVVRVRPHVEPIHPRHVEQDQLGCVGVEQRPRAAGREPMDLSS